MTIKERVEQMYNDFNVFCDDPNTTQPMIDEYVQNILLPTYLELTIECESIGHVDLETITRDDEEHTQYYVCDECGKQVELGPAPQ